MTTVAFDFETALIRPGLLAPPPVCLTAFDDLQHGQKSRALIWHCYLERKGQPDPWQSDSYKFLRHHLESVDSVLVGANTAFDLAVAATAWPDLLPLIFEALDAERVYDVQINERLIDISRGELDGKWIADPEAPEGNKFIKHLYSLADIAKRYGLRDRTSEKHDPEGWRMRYWELRNKPIIDWPAAAIEYAQADAEETWRVFDRQKKQSSHLLADAARQCAYAFSLHLLSCRGLRTDSDHIHELAIEKKGELARVRAVLVRHGLIRGDDVPKAQRGTRDIKAAQARMIEACKACRLEPVLTAKGAICLDADACERVAAVDEAFAVYARYLTLSNIVDSQIPQLLMGTVGPIQPRFNVLVESGRTSCSAAKPRKGMAPTQHGFQVQNVRREPGIRECFRAREGYFFADADYSGLELCTMAQACVDLLGESKLGEALNAGLDPHLAMGASLLGISYEQAIERKHEKEVKQARQLAKCFHPETEVLTRRGWVRIDALSVHVEVACPIYDERSKDFRISWAYPTRLTSRSATELVHLKNEGIDLRVTPDHRFAAWRKNGAMGEFTADRLHLARYWPNAGTAEGDLAYDESLLRMAIATQADGSYPKEGKQIRFGFTKERKIKRFRELFPISWYKETTTSQGATQFVVQAKFAAQIKALLTPRKTIPFEWVHLTRECREIVIDELVHWDGSQSGAMKCFHYASVEKENIDALQAIASITGRKTRVSRTPRTIHNAAHKDSYTLSIKLQDRTRGGSGGFEPVVQPYNGLVYCLTTPTDHVLVRDGGIPVITKQCANFGYPGGLGAARFVDFAKGYGVALTEQQAMDLKDQWLRQWPEFHHYFKSIKGQIDKVSGRIPLVKQIRSERLRGNLRFTEACNTYFQGLGADVAKHALFEVTKACYTNPTSPLFGSYPVNFVHDQIIAEVPIDVADEAAHELGKLMCETANNTWLPDVPVRCEPCLSVWWSKDAVAVYNKAGKLWPWDLAKRDAKRTGEVFKYADGKVVEW